MYRGGAWYYGASAGVFSLYGSDSRGRVDTGIGFRAAYIPEIR